MVIFNVDEFIVQEEYDAKWIKVFDHNATGGVFFQDEKDALFSNTEQKYSILGYLPRINRFESRYYEFYIEFIEKKDVLIDGNKVCHR